MNDEMKVSKSMLIRLLTKGCTGIDCNECPFLHSDFNEVCNNIDN